MKTFSNLDELRSFLSSKGIKTHNGDNNYEPMAIRISDHRTMVLRDGRTIPHLREIVLEKDGTVFCGHCFDEAIFE